MLLFVVEGLVDITQSAKKSVVALYCGVRIDLGVTETSFSFDKEFKISYT